MKAANWAPVGERPLDAAAAALLLPLVVSFRVQCRVIGRDRAYEAMSQRGARWPGVYGQRLRRELLRRIGTRMGHDVNIGFGTVFRRPPITLGDHVAIGQYSVVVSAHIGNHVMMGDRAAIYDGSGQHRIDRLDVPVWDQPGTVRPLRIGDDCMIGSGATILADIGDHCVVGAGSVVTKPVPDYAVVAGAPARKIADRRERAGAAPPGREDRPAGAGGAG